MKKQILYLTCIENILYSGVLQSQVIDLLKKIHQQDQNLSITLLALVPIHNYFKYIKRRKIYIHDLQQTGIEFKIRPIIFLTRFFYMKRWQIHLLRYQTLPIVAFYLWRKKPVIVHTRSYPASYIVALLKHRFNFQLIFDMKGLYIAEAMFLQRFSTLDAKKWEAIEKWLLNQADLIVGVSPEFLNYVSPAYAEKYSTIPCHVNSEFFIHDVNTRNKIRKKFNLISRYVFVFSGSIGLWERIQSIYQLFNNIKVKFPAAFLLILTQTHHKEIYKIFEKIGNENYLILQLSPEQIPAFLMASDFGLLIRQKHLINKVSLTVKFGEYLAAGLPVIVTASTGEAARLVMTYQCGIVIEDENDPEIAKKIEQLIDDYSKLQQNGAKLIAEYLDINTCAGKYLKIYYQLLNTPKHPFK